MHGNHVHVVGGNSYDRSSVTRFLPNEKMYTTYLQAGPRNIICTSTDIEIAIFEDTM